MRNSVSWKIVFCIICLTLFSGVGYVVLFNSADRTVGAFEEETQRLIVTSVKKQASDIAAIMNTMEKRTIDLAKAGEAFRNIAQENYVVPTEGVKGFIVDYFKAFPEAIGGGLWYEPNELDLSKRLFGPYAYWENGQVVFTWDLSADDYNYLAQDWYTQALPQGWDRKRQREKEVYWTAPYADEAGTGALMISVLALMHATDKRLIGISSIDISLGQMQEMVADINVSPSNKPFAIDLTSKKVLAWPTDDTMVMKDYQAVSWMTEISSLVEKKAGEVLQTTFTEEGRIWSLYAVKTHTGIVVGAAVPHDEIFALSREIGETNNMTLMVLTPLLLLLLIGIWILLLKVLVRPLNNLTQFARAVSGGDLDAQLQGAFRDELEVLATATQNMVRNLKEMMGQAEADSKAAQQQAEMANEAKAQAEEAMQKAESARKDGMLQAASQLEEIAMQVGKASGLLASQLQEAAGGADVQRERTSEAATAMEQMNVSVLEVANNASRAAESADEARSEATAGSEIVRDVLDAIGQVSTKTGQMVEGLNALGEQAEDIGRIMSVISDIADQTNLLALNAAIEAARAGEAGRGFAVVADEVRKLAEKTMQATKEVDTAVSSIQSGTRSNIEGIHDVANVVGDTADLAGKSGHSLESIFEIVESTADQVRSIATASEEQSAASEQISRSTEEVNSIAAETSQAMQQAADAVRDLASLAEELNELIEQLKRD